MGSGWDRGDLNSGYAIWDTFPNVGSGPFGPGSLGTFADDAPDSDLGLTSPLLDQAAAGPARTGSGHLQLRHGTFLDDRHLDRGRLTKFPLRPETRNRAGWNQAGDACRERIRDD